MLSKTVNLGMNLALMFALVGCGMLPTPAPAPTPTPIIIIQLITATFMPPTATLTPAPTSTATPRPSSTPDLAATQESADQQALIQKLFDGDFISTTNWRHDSLISYSDEWAKLGWYSWKPVPSSTSADFIIRTDVSWESASNTPDDSGCGFVFREQPNKDHYVIYIAMNGYLQAAHNLSSNWVNMGDAYYGKGSLSAKHNLTLVVSGNTFSVLVDDKFIRKYSGFKDKLTSGELAYTVISGTNKDFGTRCQFENTQLWTNPD